MNSLIFWGTIILVAYFILRKIISSLRKPKSEETPSRVKKTPQITPVVKIPESPRIIRKQIIISPTEEKRPQRALGDYRFSTKSSIGKDLIKVDKDREILNIKGRDYVFDKDTKVIYEKWWENDDDLVIITNKEGYLISKNKRGYNKGFHNFLMDKEIEELAEERGCSKADIHVHHINGNPSDNRMKNLKVLYKDDHAREHGFDSWKDFQRFRMAN